MRNITVSVDEETHRMARIRAAELDTSVSALVRDFLRSLADQTAQWDQANGERNYCLSNWMGGSSVTVGFRPRDLDEVLADFDARGVGVSETLTREELYTEAIEGHIAPR